MTVFKNIGNIQSVVCPTVSEYRNIFSLTSFGRLLANKAKSVIFHALLIFNTK